MLAFTLCHAILVLNEAVIYGFQCWNLMHSVSVDCHGSLVGGCVCVREREMFRVSFFLLNRNIIIPSTLFYNFLIVFLT